MEKHLDILKQTLIHAYEHIEKYQQANDVKEENKNGKRLIKHYIINYLNNTLEWKHT